MIRDEADRHRYDVPHTLRRRAPPGARRDPGLPTARASDRPTGTPTTSARPAAPHARATRRAVSRHCAPYGSPDASTRCGKAVRAEDDVDASRARPPASAKARPRRAPRTPRRARERRGSSERARSGFARGRARGRRRPSAGSGRRTAREKCGASTRLTASRHALLRHLSDDLLDPGRPVAHAEVAAEVVAELGLERVDLPRRDLEERRAPADRAVVLGDLVDDRSRRGTAVADVREVAGDLVERRRPSVRHDEDADRRGARHGDVRSRTCSTSRRTLSGGVCGVSPCPTLKT